MHLIVDYVADDDAPYEGRNPSPPPNLDKIQ